MNDLIKIPAKSTFKLNEVCQITGVKPYVLKFWEEQFEDISPIVSATGKKLFEHRDINAIAFVKKLLFEEKLSVDEAKVEVKLRLNQLEGETSHYSEEAVKPVNIEETKEEFKAVIQKELNSEIIVDTKEDDFQSVAKQIHDDAVDEAIQTDLEDVSQIITEEIPEKDKVEMAAIIKAPVDQVAEDILPELPKEVIEEKTMSVASIDVPVIETPEEIMISSPEPFKLFKKVQKSVLSDKDKQHLVLAKAKLQNMLMMASQIQTRENWQ